MTEYLRVEQKDTGHQLTVSRTVYEFAPETYKVLDGEPATDAGNDPLPPIYKTAAESTPPQAASPPADDLAREARATDKSTTGRQATNDKGSDS